MEDNDVLPNRRLVLNLLVAAARTNKSVIFAYGQEGLTKGPDAAEKAMFMPKICHRSGL